MFLNLKYLEEGTMNNISQWFVKAPIAGPHLFLFPLLSKAALRAIYTAGIVRSFLNFPCWSPVSMPERITFHKGLSEASPHSSPGPCAFISAAALLSVIPHFWAPRWAPLAAAGTAGRNGKWSTHSLGKRNWRQNESFKDGTGGFETSWIKSPVPWSHITFI